VRSLVADRPSSRRVLQQPTAWPIPNVTRRYDGTCAFDGTDKPPRVCGDIEHTRLQSFTAGRLVRLYLVWPDEAPTTSSNRASRKEGLGDSMPVLSPESCARFSRRRHGSDALCLPACWALSLHCSRGSRCPSGGVCYRYLIMRACSGLTGQHSIFPDRLAERQRA